MSEIEENAFQLTRYLVEAGGSQHGWGTARQALNLSADEFESAYKYLNGLGHCHKAGKAVDEAIIMVDNSIYPYFTQAKRERVNLTHDAEVLLKYLIDFQTPGRPITPFGALIKNLEWSEKRCRQACQILGDECLIKGQSASNNPYFLISVTPDGRKTVRNSFRLLVSPTAFIQMGDHITTNIGGSNNIVSVASTLTSVNQSVQANSYLSDTSKQDIESLLKQLNDALQDAQPENEDDAEAVAELAKTLVENATREKPNKRLVELSADGLKKAAGSLATIVPQVLVIADAIITFIQQLHSR